MIQCPVGQQIEQEGTQGKLSNRIQLTFGGYIAELLDGDTAQQGILGNRRRVQFEGMFFDLIGTPGQNVAPFALWNRAAVAKCPTLMLEIGGIELAKDTLQDGFLRLSGSKGFFFKELDGIGQAVLFEHGDKFSAKQQGFYDLLSVFISAGTGLNRFYFFQGAFEQALFLKAVHDFPVLGVVTRKG